LGQFFFTDNIILFVADVADLAEAFFDSAKLHITNPEWIDIEICRLYCLIKANETGFTREIFDEWVAGVSDESIADTNNYGIKNMIEDLQWEYILQRYQVGLSAQRGDCEALCTDCDDELLVNFAGELSPVPYTVVTGTVYEHEADMFSLRKTGTGNCGSGLHCLEFVANFEAEETISSIKAFVSCNVTGSPAGELYYCVFIVKSGSTELYNNYLEANNGAGFQEFNFDITELPSTDLTVIIKRGTSAGDVTDFRATNITFNRSL